MIHIPSSEIKPPSFHADNIGFVFMWQGHLLRGVYPDAVPQARHYFESGFIDEIVAKGLFPRTWLSEYENEQFGLIIEHELIQPVTYASEWNFEMLKDAALMVLEIAQIGLKYGFNMIDCHKLNVLFKDNKPLYVDLGSFIPLEKGSTGWIPYESFLSSYYYILDLCRCGCTQLAKRMMAPHLELRASDYWLFKRPLYRSLPQLLTFHLFIHKSIVAIASACENRFSGGMKFVKTVCNKVKLSKSQRLKSEYSRIKGVKLPPISQKKILPVPLDWLPMTFNKYGFFINLHSITFIDCKIEHNIIELLNGRSIISIQIDESKSRREYMEFKDNIYHLQSVHFNPYNPVYTRGKEPEKRLCSDIVVIGCLNINKDDKWSVHNAIVKIKACEAYTISGYMAIATKETKILKEIISSYYPTLAIIPDYAIIFKSSNK